jgi:hypothetical protein
LEVYSDKLLDIAQKNASLIWGNQSFTAQDPKEIFALPAANGNLTAGGKLNANGKKMIQQFILSKIMVYQTLVMMTDKACQVIEQQCDIFTKKAPTRNKDGEMDGLTIVALIYQRLHPHHKVDMYAEIQKAKKSTVAQFGSDIHLFFDAIKSIKLQNDQKDSAAYTDDAFDRDLFLQLKDESLPLDFKHEFTSLELAGKWTRKLLLHSLSWTMQAHITPTLLDLVLGNWSQINMHRL